MSKQTQTEKAPVSQNDGEIEIGMTVKHSDSVIRKMRDAWLGCGREPYKSTLKTELERGTVMRGKLLEYRDGQYARFAVVLWDNGNESHCLRHLIQSA